MSSVDSAFTKQYEAEVKEAYQRRGSLLRGTVRYKQNVKGASTTFQKIGYGTATSKSRGGEIPPMNLDHTPVECTLVDSYAGDWIDKLDEYKIEHDERRALVEAGAMALGRKTDSHIVLALDTNATYTTSVNLSAVALSTLTGWLTTMGARDVPIVPGEVTGVVSWEVWNKIIQINEFKSSDFVGADMPFARGLGARMWGGVMWVPHSGLTIASNIRKNHLYHRLAVGMASGAEVSSDITWHGDRASHFVNNMMSQGAKTIDVVGVHTLLVTENA